MLFPQEVDGGNALRRGTCFPEFEIAQNSSRIAQFVFMYNNLNHVRILPKPHFRVKNYLAYRQIKNIRVVRRKSGRRMMADHTI